MQISCEMVSNAHVRQLTVKLRCCQQFPASAFLNNHEKGPIYTFETFTSDILGNAN